MTGLGPDAMALIAEARDGDDPTRADQERVEAAVAARLAAGAVAALAAAAAAKTSASVSSAPGAMGAHGLTWLGAKTLTWVAALGTLGGTVAIIMAYGPARTTTLGARAASAPALAAPEVVAPLAGPSGSIEPVASAQASPREPPIAVDPRPRVVRAPISGLTASPSSRAPSSTGDVAAEVRLLGEAHAAIQGGQAERALVLLEEHARRYPNGALGEEREAARIAALCEVGRTVEARSAADRFLRASPLSPHAGRVRASCGVASPSPSF